MKTMSRAIGAAWIGLLCTAAAHGALIGTGPFGLSPAIIGSIKPGDADEAARDFAGELKHPLTLIIRTDSDPAEVGRLGLWLRERRPAIELKTACVGSCARAVLMSGTAISIKPGTVIAFGGMSGVPAKAKDQIDAGELFTDDARSLASRDRFLASFGKRIERSLAWRERQAQLAPLPDDARLFLDAIVGGWRITQLSFHSEGFRFGLAGGRHRCLWWLPDAQGLQRLGLDVPGYQPASRAAAAKLLGVAEDFIYAGPLLGALPEQPLCGAPPGETNLPMLP